VSSTSVGIVFGHLPRIGYDRPWLDSLPEVDRLEFKLEGKEFITLQSLLEAAGLSETGGSAKHAILGGEVKMDGEVELRRGKKIRAGQVVSFGGQEVTVVS
jgi:ribosome-associated protein